MNNLTDNIYNLRFGYKENSYVENKNSRRAQLTRVLTRRTIRIDQINELIKQANLRSAQIMTWGIHSDVVAYQQKIRIMEDIVRLV